jgi:hypothetical protein
MQSPYYSHKDLRIKQEFSDAPSRGIPVAMVRVTAQISITAIRVATCATHGR